MIHVVSQFVSVLCSIHYVSAHYILWYHMVPVLSFSSHPHCSSGIIWCCLGYWSYGSQDYHWLLNFICSLPDLLEEQRVGCSCMLHHLGSLCSFHKVIWLRHLLCDHIYILSLTTFYCGEWSNLYIMIGAQPLRFYYFYVSISLTPPPTWSKIYSPRSILFRDQHLSRPKPSVYDFPILSRVLEWGTYILFRGVVLS